MAKQSKVSFWTDEVARQKRFIDECGGTLQGYIDRYGDPGVNTADGKKMYGDGGTAIYNADQNALKRAEMHLEEARKRSK